MQESIFGEFQYFIKRINKARAGGGLADGETLEDLEQRFRRQVENGLVILEPHAQELAMEVLLANISEEQKLRHLKELRKTGDTSFVVQQTSTKKLQSKGNAEADMERALDLIVAALKKAGLTVRKQPLIAKMLTAAHSLGGVDYCDIDDLKLLFVKTVQISGHVKKADPTRLAAIFSEIVE